MSRTSAPVHGRYSTYSNGKCRCDQCRAAWAAYHRRWRAQQRGVPAYVGHGTTSAYNNYACRCQSCRDAWASHKRDMRARREMTS